MVYPKSASPAVLRISILALVLAVLLAGCGLFGDDAGSTSDDGLVRAVEKAPVAPDGAVAGRTTDLVLHLDAALDPNEPGLPFRSGDQIRVTLPEAFTRVSDLPLLDIFACLDRQLRCDTAVLLVGWPQGALGAPPPLGYAVRYDGSHTIVFTATADHPVNPPSSPGLKQIHLLLNSFTNPPAGVYEIGVSMTTEAGVRHGIGEAQIRPSAHPSIAVTNAMHPGFANSNYQVTAPDSLTALPFDFLLWNSAGQPFEGVTIEGDRLLHAGTPVGEVSIEAPAGAEGQAVFATAASAQISTPVTGIPVGHLRARFRAGSATGTYRVTVALDGGDAVQMVVQVR